MWGQRPTGRQIPFKTRSQSVQESDRRCAGPHTSFSLSVHLGQAGRREEALAASEEAVAAYRELAGNNMAAYGPDLARSLNNLSNNLGESGRDVYKRQLTGGTRPASTDDACQHMLTGIIASP